MTKILTRLVLVLAQVAGLAAAANASTITFTLGSAVPSFTDGQSVGILTYNAVVAGNTTPFNGFIGSDPGANFSAAWAYSYSPLSDTVASATLTLGLFDGDSAATGDQVGSFTFGGVNLTSTLNTALNGHGGASSEYDIYTITLPSTTFAALAAGTPGANLTLQGPQFGSPFNGAGLDFSTLTINTTPATSAVPEPASLILLGTGLIGAGVRRYRRRSQ